uniref:Uncharacterized protein n=1 Tax=Oryza punctata TaxID=4537 RepID=A0A0E0LUB7_ORYPU
MATLMVTGGVWPPASQPHLSHLTQIPLLSLRLPRGWWQWQGAQLRIQRRLRPWVAGRAWSANPVVGMGVAGGSVVGKDVGGGLRLGRTWVVDPWPASGGEGEGNHG